MKVLVINSGSSSIKYQLFDMGDRTVLAAGLLEQIGEPESRLSHHTRSAEGEMTEVVQTGAVPDHRAGMQQIAAFLAESGVVQDTRELLGIGHRVVHGGEAFEEPTLIDEFVLAAIREESPLAPLHNPANIIGIEVALAACPDVPQVAVFDTAFHQTMPPHAYHYALPHELYTTYHIRRYGFHGTSHAYVAKQAAQYVQRPLDTLNLLTIHLGNGASMCAIAQGQSVDTSMGLTPLAGLIMGTRCGDLDPAVIFHLSQVTGKSNAELDALLNTQSGLKGICGANDMREVQRLAAAGNELAQLAIDMFTYRIKKYIGAYYAVLGHVDALVFTAGIGEHAPAIRAQACQGLAALGIAIDAQKNTVQATQPCEIQTDESPVKVLVVPTNEELEIAEQTVRCIEVTR